MRGLLHRSIFNVCACLVLPKSVPFQLRESSFSASLDGTDASCCFLSEVIWRVFNIWSLTRVHIPESRSLYHGLREIIIAWVNSELLTALSLVNYYRCPGCTMRRFVSFVLHIAICVEKSHCTLYKQLSFVLYVIE